MTCIILKLKLLGRLGSFLRKKYMYKGKEYWYGMKENCFKKKRASIEALSDNMLRYYIILFCDFNTTVKYASFFSCI